MRRKQGTLIPIERSILAAAMMLCGYGEDEFHGYRIAKEIKWRTNARLLTGHGTLYRALGRLQDLGFLSSRWEDANIAAHENRPRRKLYSLSLSGVRAGEAAISELETERDGQAPFNRIRRATW